MTIAYILVVLWVIWMLAALADKRLLLLERRIQAEESFRMYGLTHANIKIGALELRLDALENPEQYARFMDLIDNEEV